MKPKKYVDQIIVHKDFPSESLSAKDIYFMAHPSRAVEYMHCTSDRRTSIGSVAQTWTNRRISPNSGTCKSHFGIPRGRHPGKRTPPRLLEFVGFGGTMTKTGHAKVFSWDSVKTQFEAEGIPLR